MEADGCVCVTGRTAENRAHLSAGFEAHLRRQLGSPHLVSQELDGQFILEPEGGMWRYDRLFELTLGMLGMAGLRTWEKSRGLSR